MLLATLSLSVNGQNLLSSRKNTDSDKPKTEVAAKVSKKQKATKEVETELDPMDLSLDYNLLVPSVPEKQHASVALHINNLAKKLASQKRERVESMRNGEVVVVTIPTDLLFAPNDTVLSKISHSLLQPYAHLLQEDGMYKFVVVCHTDNTGSENYTDNLSEARVNAVAEYLLEQSDNDNAVVVPYALGASDPILPNNTLSNRSANRRLEIFIVPERKLIELARTNKLK